MIDRANKKVVIRPELKLPLIRIKVRFLWRNRLNDKYIYPYWLILRNMFSFSHPGRLYGIHNHKPSTFWSKICGEGLSVWVFSGFFEVVFFIIVTCSITEKLSYILGCQSS